jgi:hypothetical protein
VWTLEHKSAPDGHRQSSKHVSILDDRQSDRRT